MSKKTHTYYQKSSSYSAGSSETQKVKYMYIGDERSVRNCIHALMPCANPDIKLLCASAEHAHVNAQQAMSFRLRKHQHDRMLWC